MNTKTTITEADLEDIVQAASLDEDAIHTAYSGRGMYGATCVGFDLDYPEQMLQLGAALQEVLGYIPGASTDSMGRGIIVYFRSLRLDEAE